MKHRKGFTLTELVVLIAAGALVSGMLLASLSDAKEKVRAAACMSNLREISLAIRLYTDDHNGFMPTASYGNVGNGTLIWPKLLRPYLPLRGLNPTSAPHKVFACPSANYPGFANSELSLTYSCTSAMLGFNPPSTGLTASQPRRQDQVLTPAAQTPLIIEGQADPVSTGNPVTSCRSNTPWQFPYASYDLSGSGPPGPGHYLDFRHSNSSMNIVFFDGSVRNMTFAQAKATFTKSLWEGR